MEILCSFRLVLEGKTGKEIPKLSRLEFLEKFLANNFTLSDAKLMDFCLVAYASLAAPRTLLQQLLASLNFTLDSEDSFC